MNRPPSARLPALGKRNTPRQFRRPDPGCRLSDFRNQIRIRDLPASYADEPEALGGTNTAPNPVEQLLGALGSCLAIGYTANASVRGIQIEELRIELEGHIDLPVFLGLHEGHAGYSDVAIKVYLKADASQETLEELHQQVLKTSPVGQTLEKAIPLHATLVHA